jgi:hypothetical protein
MSANGYEVAERILHTSDTRLASVLMVFGAQLRERLPLEWVDHHAGREQFCRYCEGNSQSKPVPVVTFFFNGSTVPAQELVNAFHSDFAETDAALENILKDVSEPTLSRLRDAVSALIACACHQTLLNREFLVKQIKRVPEWAKWDQVNEGPNNNVRIGKRSSPELRANMLDKL